ncbi:uncharacterized protein KY384_008195 [Bacidia gigantensis]|uniref:uncharacterized protein n=1 Tax=Bacidia gigantensis TaxID=2732470 RepID=UPI001D04258B|nr:uncharacterized protein KY384_008195 [Bacidia gigantensis]KAG8526766.1 hypothetical protein KY384_008195 [Bacidia gigantensis]
MSDSPQEAPAGSSSYKSDTMTVGDGTWDTSRNAFLLPNLVGLNFETMRYNGMSLGNPSDFRLSNCVLGMGNRFRELPGYHSLIRAHGTIAAITFLAIVPAAILVSRFYTRYPRRAVRIHIWLNILAVLLVTVIFILGNIAVGPTRRLSNPHHGVGTAIFVLTLVGFIQGWWIHRKHKRNSSEEPLGVTLHNWLGRVTALLGLAQIPLGLTLYGAPKVLFILYALAAFLLLVTYFWLTRIRVKHYGGTDYDSRYSYGPSSVADDRRRRSGSGSWLKPALAGAGVYAIANKLRRRSKDRAEGRPGPEVVGSRRNSLDDEKYSEYSREFRWEDRLLRVAAPIGLGSLVTRYYDRRYHERNSDVSSYRPPLGGATPINDPRYGPAPPAVPLPFGQPLPPAPGPYGQPAPLASTQIPPPAPYTSEHHPLNRTHSRESSYSSTLPSASGEAQRPHRVRDGLATLGAAGLAKNIWDRLRGGGGDRRLHQEQDARMHGQRFTGDGRPARHHRPGMSSISSEASYAAPHPTNAQGIPPIPAGTYPNAGVIPGAGATREAERDHHSELPLGGVPRRTDMPAIPPDPQGVLHHESSSSDAFSSPGRGDRHNRRSGRGIAPLAGATVAEASTSRQDTQARHQSTSAGEDSGVTSPPVSVKVKMHKDGRNITLSRLPEAEAEARRRARQGANASESTLSGEGGGGSRFRRREAQDRQNAEAMRIESERLAAARNEALSSSPNVPPVTPVNLPPPPPIPESSGSARPPASGSVGSPQTYDTDISTDYANNRRRRRAERARIKQAKEEREAKTGKTVGFE